MCIYDGDCSCIIPFYSIIAETYFMSESAVKAFILKEAVNKEVISTFNNSL